jgi:hypothetical protein
MAATIAPAASIKSMRWVSPSGQPLARPEDRHTHSERPLGIGVRACIARRRIVGRCFGHERRVAEPLHGMQRQRPARTDRVATRANREPVDRRRIDPGSGPDQNRPLWHDTSPQ